MSYNEHPRSKQPTIECTHSSTYHLISFRISRSAQTFMGWMYRTSACPYMGHYYQTNLYWYRTSLGRVIRCSEWPRSSCTCILKSHCSYHTCNSCLVGHLEPYWSESACQIFAQAPIFHFWFEIFVLSVSVI